ncbi:MAG TPA: DUF1902 domain-containing protein [Allosphingosinicella sp.]
MMSSRVELEVHIARDEETRCWYVARSDLPGLRLEADSASDLIREIENVAPDLIQLNHDEIVGAHTHDTARPGDARTFAIRAIIDTPLAVA